MLSPTLVVSVLLNVLIYFSFYDTDMILLIVTDLLLYFEKIIFERRGLVELQFFQQIFIDHLLCWSLPEVLRVSSEYRQSFVLERLRRNLAISFRVRRVSVRGGRTGQGGLGAEASAFSCPARLFTACVASPNTLYLLACLSSPSFLASSSMLTPCG